MFIKSQDGKRLANLDRIVAVGIVNSGQIRVMDQDGCQTAFLLGEYESEERALKIMGQIEECQTNGPACAVFAMPKK